MMPVNLAVRTKPMLLAGLLAGSILSSSVLALAARGRHGHPAYIGAPETRKEAFFKQTWGIDQVDLHTIASGSMVQFRYRVLDPERAKLLNDKKAEPHLIEETTGIKLKVEEGERIGKLRTTPPPQAGRVYWIIFGNSAHIVRHKSRVSLVIGNLRMDSLVVD